MNYRHASEVNKKHLKEFFEEHELSWDLEEGNLQHSFICESGRSILGYAGMLVHGRVAVGTTLFVHPGFRGMGIGSTMSRSLVQEAVYEGVNAFCRWPEQAEYYFRAMGMKPAKETTKKRDILSSIPEKVLQYFNDGTHGRLLAKTLVVERSRDVDVTAPQGI